MRIASIDLGFSEFPVADQWSVNVYVSGCENNCENCHNKHIQDFTYGTVLSANSLVKSIHSYSIRTHTKSIVLLGGDPLHPYNRPDVEETCKILHQEGYNICVYTGYILDELKNIDVLSKYIRFLKTGRYLENMAQKPGKSFIIKGGETVNILTLGSKNQNMYEMINTKLTQISKDGIVRIKESL